APLSVLMVWRVKTTLTVSVPCTVTAQSSVLHSAPVQATNCEPRDLSACKRTVLPSSTTRVASTQLASQSVSFVSASSTMPLPELSADFVTRRNARATGAAVCGDRVAGGAAVGSRVDAGVVVVSPTNAGTSCAPPAAATTTRALMTAPAADPITPAGIPAPGPPGAEAVATRNPAATATRNSGMTNVVTPTTVVTTPIAATSVSSCALDPLARSPVTWAARTKRSPSCARAPVTRPDAMSATEFANGSSMRAPRLRGPSRHSGVREPVRRAIREADEDEGHRDDVRRRECAHVRADQDRAGQPWTAEDAPGDRQELPHRL